MGLSQQGKSGWTRSRSYFEAPESLLLRPLTLAPLGDGDVAGRNRLERDFARAPRNCCGPAGCRAFPAWAIRSCPATNRSAGRRCRRRRARRGSANGSSCPGANCFGDAAGLFGGTRARAWSLPAARAMPIDERSASDGILLALAATAHHAIAAGGVPDLIVGHGMLGRLIARIAIARAATRRRSGKPIPARRRLRGYEVIDPDATTTRRDYAAICDASGDGRRARHAIARLAKGGEIVLAGFYDRLSFAFPPAFMREARLRIAAEFTPADIAAVTAVCSTSARFDSTG